MILVSALVPGGAERQAVQDANILFEIGHEIFLCYGLDGPLKQQLVSGVKLIDLQTGSQPEAIPRMAGFIRATSQLKAIPRLARFIRAKNIDLVMSHMFGANKVASAACFLTGRKNIVFEHGLGLWRKWYHLMLVRLVARQAISIVTCSDASRRIRTERDRVPLDKVRVMHNSFAVPDMNIENENGLSDHEIGIFRIGFAGRFDKVKQLHLLIDVALHLLNKTNEFQFILLGDGEEKSVMENLVRKIGLTKHFQFKGYVSNPISYLIHMDCFVLPSKREDFSLSLLEASYCRLPCIAFDVGGNREIILNGSTGWLIKPYDVPAMAERILQLTHNSNQLKEMKAAAKIRAQALFSQKQRGRKLMGLIQETAN